MDAADPVFNGPLLAEKHQPSECLRCFCKYTHTHTITTVRHSDSLILLHKSIILHITVISVSLLQPFTCKVFEANVG